MDFDDPSNPRRFFAESFLSSPIIVNGRNRLFQEISCLPHPNPGNRSKFLIAIRRHITLPVDRQLIHSLIQEEINPHLLKPLNPEHYPALVRSYEDLSVEEDIKRASSVMARVTAAVYESIHKWSSASIDLPCRKGWSQECITWARHWSVWDKIVNSFTEWKVMGNQRPLHGQVQRTTLSYIIDGRFTVLYTQDRKEAFFLLTYDQLLCIKDICAVRMNLFMAESVLYDKSSYRASLTAHISWQELCLITYGNKGYEVLKQTEALAKTYLSERADPLDLGMNSPFWRMVEKVKEKERTLGAKGSYLVTGYVGVLEGCDDIRVICELFGLLKVTGHPLIDVPLGGASAAKEALTPDTSKLQDVKELRWNWARMYTAAYVKAHGRWPPLEKTRLGTKLHNLYSRQEMNLPRQAYPLSDWEGVHFGKHLGFETYDNFLDLMDDKSISHYRSEAASTWDPSVVPSSHRRLLLEMLSKADIKPYKVVEMVQKGEIPWEWLIVSLYPKEREFKLAARMFAMMVFEMRMFFNIAEANLAEMVFPILPQQTMTRDKEAIRQIFLDMTQAPPEGFVRFFVEVDLSRWNLRWRKSAVYGIGSDLNDMFGEPRIYTFIHDFFEESMIMVRVAGLRPDGIEQKTPPESDLLWYNHKGGFEGIAQKLWTLCTYSMIDLAMEGVPVAYTLVGQGDNQVLSIRAVRSEGETEAEQVGRMVREITEKIEVQCMKVNQVVKPEECIESMCVISYGKDVYVMGVEENTPIKALSRVFPRTALDFPRFASNYGSIFSTCVGAAEKTSTPMSVYPLAVFHASLYAIRSSSSKLASYDTIRKSCSRVSGLGDDDLLTCLALLPSEYGGLPIVPFTEFLYKGGADPTSKALGAMKLLSRCGDHTIRRLVGLCFSDIGLTTTVPPSTLVDDPYALPLPKPVTATSAVTQLTLSGMVQRGIRNRDISAILGSDATTYRDDLTEALLCMRPFNPLIAHDMLDCSLGGVVTTVSKMFTETRTIQAMVRGTDIPVVERYLVAHVNELLYVSDRLSALPPPSSSDDLSVFDTVTRQRAYWAIPGGVTGVTSYVPMDFDALEGAPAVEEEGIRASYVPRGLDPCHTRGPIRPYTGTRTREKRAEQGYRIVGTSHAAESYKKMQFILSQAHGNPGFVLLVDSIVLSRAPTILSEYSDLLSTVVGGDMAHRYNARMSTRSAYTQGTTGILSHVAVDSDNCGPLALGKTDYPLMFQEFILAASALTRLRVLQVPTAPHHTLLATGRNALVPLESSNICLEGYPKIPLKAMPGNSIVDLADVKFARVSGPLPCKLAKTIDGREIPKKVKRILARASVSARIITELTKGGKGLAIGDGAARRTGVSLDVAEILGLGVEGVVHAISIAIAQFLVPVFSQSLCGRSPRLVWMTAAAAYASAFSAIITDHLHIHAVAQDPLLRQIGAVSMPRYGAASDGAPKRLLASLISSRVSSLLTSPLSSLYTVPVILFQSSSARSTSWALNVLTTLAFARATLARSLTGHEMGTVLVNGIEPVTRSLQDEGSLARDWERLTRYAEEKYQAINPLLSADLRAVGMGKRLLVCPFSAEEATRWARGIHLPAAEIQPDRFLPLTGVLYTEDTATALNAPLPVLYTPESQLTSTLRRIRRNRGRALGLMSTAVYRFSAFSTLMNRRVIGIIGSGNGGCAYIALNSGCVSVIGYDKPENLPLDLPAPAHYKPPLVICSQHPDRYLQSTLCFTSNLDYRVERSRTDILKEINLCDLVCLDIPSYPEVRIIEDLVPLIGKQGRWVIARAFVPESSVGYVLSTVKSVTPRLYVTWCETILGVTEVVFAFIPTRASFTYQVPRTCLVPALNLAEESLLPGSASFSALMLLGSLGIPEGTDHHDVAPLIESRVHSILGDYDTRPSYNEYTVVVSAAIAWSWARLSHHAREQQVRDMLSSGEASYEIAGKTLVVKSRVVIELIVKYASRMTR